MKTSMVGGDLLPKMRRLAAAPRLLYRKLNKTILHVLGRWVLRPRASQLPLTRLGSGPGGWAIPAACLDASSICYCVGVGLDASFDFALAQQYGCQVHSFDPTPSSVAYMEQARYDRSRVHFHALGVWDADTELRFYYPVADDELLSVYDLKGTGKYVVCKCQRVSSIMRDLGHDRIDLLKLDIEGAWRRVIRNLVDEKIRIPVLCVELDSPTSLRLALWTIHSLRSIGLEFVHREKDNFLFVHKTLVAAAANDGA